MKSLLTALILVFLMASCSQQGQQMMHKNISGKAGELVIVISKKSWDDVPGNLLRQTLAQPQYSLPQDEPLFDLISVPQEAFKEIFQSTRNIIQTRISPIVENPGVTFTDNIWAYPQATVQINARNNEEFEKLFKENSDKIIGYFLKAERDRMASNYRDYHDKAVFNTLQTKYDVMLQVPPGFQISQEKENFVWIRLRNSRNITVHNGLLVPLHLRQYIHFKLSACNKRDSILRANVPGPLPKVAIWQPNAGLNRSFQITRHNGNYAADIRGLMEGAERLSWEVRFVMLAELGCLPPARGCCRWLCICTQQRQAKFHSSG
jgi:hypothetical protein